MRKRVGVASKGKGVRGCGQGVGRGISRRDLLAVGGAAAVSGVLGGTWLVPSSARGSAGRAAASERITVGLIGHGLMGRGHLRRLAGDRSVQVLAVCDVDGLRRQSAKAYVEQVYGGERGSGTYRGCVAYKDYRELLRRADIDAVVIATPDHWHALQSIDAARAGKDVYCEKPVSITVRQGRQLVEAVRRYGRVFQNGSQYRSIPTIRRVCEFIRAGGLGKVKSVFTLWGRLGGFLSRPGFRPYAGLLAEVEVRRSYVPMDLSFPGEAIPEGLDWDMWVGPALWRPYNRVYHTNPNPGVVPWSFCEDFGAGPVTWYHSHSLDVIQYAIGAETGGPVEVIHPGSGAFPTLTCRYANGVLLHHVDHWGMVKKVYGAVPADARLEGNFGGVFVGERGWITSMSAGGAIEGGPKDIFEELKLATRAVNIGENNHHENWLECIRTRRQPSSHEEIGHRGASVGHLVIIAHKLGRSLRWDARRERFVDDAGADRLLSVVKRSPWHS